ncbi:hypothetical protein DERF_002859 [Dermatophagoides farinae]|uniref:Uncharacterized protein n=1 Tax=Dermatophagoides farinae TaxID=6954 RepID=A0A922ICG7_DERFA|nr:hypothetical protein DERF_002859 [Dermatophagoides farinae]
MIMRTPILGCYNGNYCDDDDAPKKVTQYNLHIMFDAIVIGRSISNLDHTVKIAMVDDRFVKL